MDYLSLQNYKNLRLHLRAASVSEAFVPVEDGEVPARAEALTGCPILPSFHQW
jgi:hypothetical protein